MFKVADYTGRISPGALRDHGVTDVIRYLSWWHRWDGRSDHPDVNPKVLLRPEYEQLLAGGVRVTANWEYDSRDWLTGAEGGAAHAAEAVVQARLLGYPKGCTIIGSADFDMSAEQWTGAGYAYARSFAAVVQKAGFRPGVYGPYDVLDWVHDAGLMDVFWQSMSRAHSHYRNGVRYLHAQLHQTGTGSIAGVSVDWSDTYADNWGQAAGLAVPLPPDGELLMGWRTASRTSTDTDRTRTVQGLLLARGYPVGSRTGGPDGSWGDVTDASLGRFQAEHHVPNSVKPDGTGDRQCGPATLRALVGLG